MHLKGMKSLLRKIAQLSSRTARRTADHRFGFFHGRAGKAQLWRALCYMHRWSKSHGIWKHYFTLLKGQNKWSYNQVWHWESPSAGIGHHLCVVLWARAFGEARGSKIPSEQQSELDCWRERKIQRKGERVRFEEFVPYHNQNLANIIHRRRFPRAN